jgi:hypothetical protein
MEPVRPRGRDDAVASQIDDPFIRRTLKVSLHLRRFLPFYAIGAIWVLGVASLPLVARDGSGDRGGDVRASQAATIEPAGGGDGTGPVPTGGGGTSPAGSP